MLSCGVLCKELLSRGIFASKLNLNLDSNDPTEYITGVQVITNDANKSIVFPVDFMLETLNSVSDAADMIQQAVEDSKLPEGVDYDYFLSKDYIISHVQLALTERFWQPFLMRDSVFTDISEYCYIAGIYKKQRWMIEIREDMLSNLGLTKNELWEIAAKNTFASKSDFVLKPVADILGKQVKRLVDNSPIKYLYSVSNGFGLQGGVQILNPRIYELMDKYAVSELVIYPQSENNFLVAPNVTGVLSTLKNIAENDTNYNFLSNYLYVIGKDFEVQLVVPFYPV